ncbi:uncharacterized protein [Prorops nasuta]|uniref:uncharacterized protein n=1 Tax=Prorops nasuta TaxID=863751 RepID=UPI0034CEB3CD
MVQACCVLGCNSTAGVPSHKFPVKEERAEKWVKAIKLFKRPVVNNMNLKNMRICYEHFEEADYRVGGYKTRKLKENVIPSVNLPNISYFSQFNEQIDINLNDHNGKEANKFLLYSDLINEIGMQCEPTSNNTESDDVILEIQNECEQVSDILQIKVEGDPETGTEDTTEIVKGCKRVKMSPSIISRMHLTPKARKLYQIASNLHREQLKISKKLKIYRQRLIDIKRYSQSKSVKKLMCSLSKEEKVIIEKQLRKSIFKPKVRRKSNLAILERKK